jgi:hypothetical protein
MIFYVKHCQRGGPDRVRVRALRRHGEGRSRFRGQEEQDKTMLERWLTRTGIHVVATASVAVLAVLPSHAQDTSAPPEPAAVAQSPAPLTEAELEVLVARIALYPDELVSLIASASIYPLQIVEAERFLQKKATDAALQPKDTWDGSIVSLLNYPQIVRMMADDLDWTQAFGDALAYQQKDVLVAIQQLRSQAVANGVIKTDDKVTVVNEGDTVIIQPTSPEVVYVPQYAPETLYAPAAVPVPVAYYPTAYPSYYNPTATYFAGAVTGAVFASALDWDDWNVWGGNYNGDVDINCNGCFNNVNFNGKVNINDVDWKNVDRSKINIDRTELNKFERNDVKANLSRNDINSFERKSATVRNDRNTNATATSKRVNDVRANKVSADGNRNDRTANRQSDAQRPTANRQPDAQRPTANRQPDATRPAGKPKPAARVDSRPKQPSALGEVRGGKTAKIQSDRGKQSRATSPARPKKPAGGRGGDRRR